MSSGLKQTDYVRLAAFSLAASFSLVAFSPEPRLGEAAGHEKTPQVTRGGTKMAQVDVPEPGAPPPPKQNNGKNVYTYIHIYIYYKYIYILYICIHIYIYMYTRGSKYLVRMAFGGKKGSIYLLRSYLDPLGYCFVYMSSVVVEGGYHIEISPAGFPNPISPNSVESHLPFPPKF